MLSYFIGADVVNVDDAVAALNQASFTKYALSILYTHEDYKFQAHAFKF